jgi:membrane-associated phospholipid phosphatase
VSNRHDFLVVNSWARHTGLLHGPLKLYAADGVVLFGVLLLLGWWLARRSGPRAVASALWAGAAVLVAVAVNQPIVAHVHEARPYTVLPHILVLAHRSTDPSFPSDHATMAGAAAMGLWFVHRRLAVAAWVAALLMAFARVYIGAHWPRDVVAGLVLGAAVALLGQVTVRRPLERLVTWASRTRLRPLLAADASAG